MNHKIRYSKLFFTGIFFFILVLSMTICASQIYAQDAQIYLDSTAQVIRGYGAANIVGWRPDMTDTEINEAFGKNAGQLGFSILRIRIPPVKNQWASYVPTAKKAYDMGVKIIASPWSPPASMKTNNSTVAGSLMVSEYPAYAAWLKSFANYMANNGVPLYAISVQNEPDINVSYESCDWSPEQMLQFVKEYGDSVGTRLMAPESFQFRRVMSDPLLNDSTAAAHLNIVAGHIYGGGLSKYPLALQKGKEVWMTEHITDSQDPGNEWPLSLDIGTEMQKVMKADMSAYVFWYIVRFYGPIGDGTSGTRAGAITKRGYVMSQFSRFIRPGYVRVHSSGPFGRSYVGVNVTAYKDSANKVVIVATNPNTSAKQVNFIFGDNVTGTFHPYVTSGTQDVVKQTDIQASGSSFTVTLPAESITTYVSDSLKVVTTATEKPPARLPESFKLLQNYPNPFNPTTTIRYRLPAAARVTMKVYDILGREVATLVDRRVSAGEHSVRFDASHLASGIYIYQLKAGNITQTKSMTLIK